MNLCYARLIDPVFEGFSDNQYRVKANPKRGGSRCAGQEVTAAIARVQTACTAGETAATRCSSPQALPCQAADEMSGNAIKPLHDIVPKTRQPEPSHEKGSR